MARVVKNLPDNAGDAIQSLGQEDPLEEGLATSPVFLPGESHGQRSLVGPATRLSGCKTGAPSQADVDRPDPQEVLVSKEACLQFYR